MPIELTHKDKKTGKVVVSHYMTVAERIDSFRKNEEFKDYAVKTKIVSNTEYVIVRAKIVNQDGKVVATGTAEENRNDGYINKTSALENCETSAVGRALAFLGFAGTEIASADEIVAAQEQQVKKACWESATNTMQATLDNYDSIVEIKKAIEDKEPYRVVEAWMELEANIKGYLWKAPSKGGPFTTSERAYFQSSEYVEARNAYNGLVVESNEETEE